MTASLRQSGVRREGGLEAAAAAPAVDRATVQASISALDEQVAKVAGGRNRVGEDQRRIVEASRSAGEKILNEGAAARLQPIERLALEAVAIADGSRPALLIRCNAIDPADEKAGEWADELGKFAGAIRAVAPSVGRIDNHGRHVGTGWMLRPGYVVTNRHVAQDLSKDPTAQQLELSPLREPTICFGFEADEPEHRPRHVIKSILFCGATHIDEYAVDFASLDLAVLKVEPAPQAELPPALPSVLVEKTEVTRGTNLFALGYPGPTARSSLPQKTLLRLFGEHVSVKRLSPGEIDLELGGVSGDASKRSVAHDATTLGGSSGSVILGFDQLAKPRVLGIHFGGYEVKYGPMGEVEYRGRNYGHCFVAMPDVRKAIDAAIAADRTS